jgi:hypothetical protein
MRFVKITLFLALGLLSAFANAGMKTNYATYVTPGYAFAGLSSARYNAGGLEYLSCDLYSSGYIYCSARDASGNSGYCYTNTTDHPTFAPMISGMSSASAVAFWWDTTTNICTSFFVRNGSNMLP